MTQERMGIEDLARFLPDEARFAFNVSGGVWYGATHPLNFGDAGWQDKHGHFLAGIIIDADGLAEIRSKKRWRAEKGGRYFFASDNEGVVSSSEDGGETDNTRYACGNYWRRPECAQDYDDACKALAIKMHEENED